MIAQLHVPVRNTDLTQLRRLAISLIFPKHELVVLHDHPGAGRDLSQPWAPAFAGVDFE
jgi:hypothetical protein